MHRPDIAGLAVLSGRQPSGFWRYAIQRRMWPRRLQGGNAEQMYFSLTQRLAALPEETILFPGHNLRAPQAGHYRRTEEDESLPEICFPETVLSCDGLSLIAAD